MSGVASFDNEAELALEAGSDKILGESVGLAWAAYPEYKDSGAEWPKLAPSHWAVKRLRFTVKTNPTKSEIKGHDPLTEVSFVPMEAVGEYGGINLEGQKMLEDVAAGYTYFRDGDVLVAKITPCFENGKGALAANLLNGIGFGTTELHVIRPAKDQLDFHFLFYLSISHPFRKFGEAEMYGAGGQKRIPEDFIKDFRAFFPPVEEQATIATFLDRETARIDALIAKKQRLIELLQEKRTALISQAVTKGLDPGVSVKDSGVEWLGEMPAHWEVKRLKFLVQDDGHGIQMGPFGTMLTNLEFTDTGFKLYGQENTINNDFEVGKRWLLPEQFADLKKYEILPGDVVLTRKGSIGQCRLVPTNITPGIADSDTIRVRLNPSVISSRFLVLILHEAQYIKWQVQAARRGAILGGLNTATIANLWIVLPPSDEQIRLLANLSSEIEKLETLHAKVEIAISRIKEYRAAIISAAVTGKIDVREMCE